MTRLIAIVPIAFLLTAAAPQPDRTRPVWPRPPDAPRVEYLGEIHCDELDPEAGFFGRVKRFLGGAAPDEQIALPFDVLVQGRMLYMTCQNLPALVAVDLDAKSYRLYDADDDLLACPIAVSGDGSSVFVTDSEARAVYRLSGDRLVPLITEGLSRPTGIAVLSGRQRLYVVDTGDHTLKIFDYEGNLIQTVGGHGGPAEGLNYPTFAAEAGGDAVLINDALNYRVKRFDADGGLVEAFGEEGDGPGTFSRPKGLAVDSHDHTYVVDNLFDNIQVFDRNGRLLLVIGDGGHESGQFWSPGGIDIVNDTIYVADTYNNRIQVLRYMGEGQ